MISTRTEMIDAKIAGNLQKVTAEKLAEHIGSFQDYKMFINIVEQEKVAAVDPSVVRNLLLASTMLGGASLLGAKYLKTHQAHGKVIEQLLADPSYADKEKVQKIYEMMSQFAPKVSGNPTFAKSVMDQLYNAPMISAPMIQQLVDVESGVQGNASLIPHTRDILTSAVNVSKVAPV